MSAQLEKIETNLIKLTMTVEPKVFEEGIQKAYLKNRGKINLPGFRKGKAPRKLLEAQFGKEIFYDDALEFIFPKIFDDAVKEHDLEIVSKPSVDIKELDGGSAEFIATVYTKPIAQVEDYSDIEYIRPDIEFTQDILQDEIDNDRKKNARIVSVTDRAVINDDLVTIDFEGFVDGVAFAGGKAENFELKIGSKSFIDNFEDQIIGKNIGDKFDAHVTFPENYHEDSLSAQPARFAVLLKDIRVEELPEPDDDFAQEISEFDTFEEYKAEVEARLKKQISLNIEKDIEGQVVEGLRKRIVVEIPQPMIEEETERLINEFARDMQSKGVDFNQYMQYTGMNVERMREMYADQAKAIVESKLAIESVVHKENVTLTDEEYNEELETLAKLYNLDKDKFLMAIGNDTKSVHESGKNRKALKMVVAVAKEVEKNNVDSEETGFDKN